ncbi:MAG: hypothetical protein LAT68_00495 [Cyclobacteriaceae bacterium]|nr:hypothetical protein [Cyclobacteriaceae bacterium]MCH8514781.1 hypothetical protein [Cyclobacteriaceae bacterium]
MKNYIFILLALVFLGSCSQKDSTKEKASSEWAFEYEKADSLVIDWMTSLNLLDWNESLKQGLFYDMNQSLILQIDAEGNILAQHDKLGDKPDALGRYLSSAVLLDDGRFYLKGQTRINLYEADGSLERTIYSPEMNAIVTSVGKRTLFIWKDQLIFDNLNPSEGLSSDQDLEYFEKLRFLQVYQGDSIREMVPVPDKSVYAEGWYFKNLFMARSFEHLRDEDLLAIISAKEMKVFIYDWKDVSQEPVLVRTIELNTEGMNIDKGSKDPIEKSQRQGMMVVGFGDATINNMYRLGEFDLFEYVAGTSGEPTVNPMEDVQAYIEELQKLTVYGYQLIDREGNIVKQEEGRFFPIDNIRPSLTLSDGTLIASYNNPEEEADEQVFYFLKIK